MQRPRMRRYSAFTPTSQRVPADSLSPHRGHPFSSSFVLGISSRTRGALLLERPSGVYPLRSLLQSLRLGGVLKTGSKDFRPVGEWGASWVETSIGTEHESLPTDVYAALLMLRLELVCVSSLGSISFGSFLQRSRLPRSVSGLLGTAWARRATLEYCRTVRNWDTSLLETTGLKALHSWGLFPMFTISPV